MDTHKPTETEWRNAQIAVIGIPISDMLFFSGTVDVDELIAGAEKLRQEHDAAIREMVDRARGAE